MRRLSALFSILALVAVALLPGPSHALAAAGANPPRAVHHKAIHHYAGHDHHAHVAGGDHGRRSSHAPCKACSIACCAPATAAVDAPAVMTSARLLHLRPLRPSADRSYANAAARQLLRPPTLSA